MVVFARNLKYFRYSKKHNSQQKEITAMTFEEMKKIVVDTLNCDADKVTMEASLTEDLEADSLDAVELNMALEDACGVSIPDEELANLKTVGDIYNYITAHA